MSWSSRKKKEGIYLFLFQYYYFLSYGHFFNIYVLPQGIVY